MRAILGLILAFSFASPAFAWGDYDQPDAPANPYILISRCYSYTQNGHLVASTPYEIRGLCQAMLNQYYAHPYGELYQPLR